jgi:hypothetical protein
MPHYFMHACDGDNFVQDDIGLDLVDLEAARNWAIDALKVRLLEELQHGTLSTGAFIFIEDHDGHVLTVPFSEVIQLH